MSQSLITWNDQSKSWLTDASSFTGFHKLLAQKVLPHTTRSDVICDVGCGLGRLDFELAPHVSEIIAVDISGYAISALEKEIAATGVSNIRTRQGNALELDADFDVILMSLFGIEDIPGVFRRCKRKHIRIVGAGRKSGLYPEKYRHEQKNAVPIVRDRFELLGISYELEMCTIEFGQPLRTIRDAEQFVLTNAPEADSKEVAVFLNEFLQSTGREDFPYYLPYQKELGIFTVDMK